MHFTKFGRYVTVFVKFPGIKKYLDFYFRSSSDGPVFSRNYASAAVPETMSSPSGELIFQPPENISKGAHVSSLEQYRSLYEQSIKEPADFWKRIYNELHWNTPVTGQFVEYNFDVNKGPVRIRWLEGATTNVCYNAVDRHVENGLGDNVAFYWEGNEPDQTKCVTYSELQKLVCQFANVLKSKGVKKGDRVAIYMPMTIEFVVAMLACVRIGAPHSIVFAGFSSGSLSERILDARCKIIVTADGTWRGEKLINLKEIVDEALNKCSEQDHNVSTCIVLKHLDSALDTNICENGTDSTNGTNPPKKRPSYDSKIHWNPGRDLWWHDLMDVAPAECEPECMDAEDPLFMLYTSGSTGKPKGVLHTTGGYMMYAMATFKYVFDYHPGDIYWCTADIGWITGHTYVTYGPLLNGATSVIFEGVPFYPDAGRFWEIVDRYKVKQFYTAPTAIRALMKYGDSFVTRHKRDSLSILGTVGEPINPEAWLWYYNVVGDKRCAVVDTFWQTETGGHVLTPLPGATPTKPGSATLPFFGVVPVILTEDGKELDGPGEGYLVFKKPWPGIMRTLYNNQERFEQAYFSRFPGYYTTGDGARRDKDGYYWVTGRIDDMLNVSGHLLSTSEVESTLVEHPAVAEAAVVPLPHPIKGECLYCYVTLKEGKEFDDALVQELKQHVRKKIGPFAQPEYIHHAPSLPKTRSGKIMRRILRKIAVGDEDLGDITTLADEAVIKQLFATRPQELRG